MQYYSGWGGVDFSLEPLVRGVCVVCVRSDTILQKYIIAYCIFIRMKSFENLFPYIPSQAQEVVSGRELRAVATLVSAPRRSHNKVCSPTDIGGDLTRPQETNMACAVFYVMMGFCGLVTGASTLIGNRLSFMAQGTLLLQLTIGVIAFSNFVVAVPLTAFNKET